MKSSVYQTKVFRGKPERGLCGAIDISLFLVTLTIYDNGLLINAARRSSYFCQILRSKLIFGF